MFDRARQRSCFIIGPMRDSELGDQARLQVLAREVVRPIMAQIEVQTGHHFDVRTPYTIGRGTTQIMRDVIYEIDRADIIIADLTDSNPNVFYELGITHALGKPCISVMEQRQTKVEFDISAYKVLKINLEGKDYAGAQATLRGPLEHAQRDADWAKFENPVIDFFRAPITYISPAFSLAQGYYLNFVKPVVESIIRRKGRYQYIYDVFVARDDGNPEENGDLIPNELRDGLALEIVVPNRISLARRNYADRFRGGLDNAAIEGDGRLYTSFYRVESNALVDVPTTIRVMEDAVRRRVRYSDMISEDQPEWREIESQEIQRFQINLQMFIDRHENNPEFKNRIRLLNYESDAPADNLAWLHAIMT